MVKITIVSIGLLCASLSVASYGAITADPTADTELVFAFMVHRHGDRTPCSETDLTNINFINDKIKALIAEWGYGQLTNVGIKTAYKTGEFIRRRYDVLLSSKYRDSELYVRSTDMTRAKMSALAAMAAVYRPAGDNWSKDVNWIPVPYTTVPAKEDFNLAYESCSKALKILNTRSNVSLLTIVRRSDVVTKLSDVLSKKDIRVIHPWRFLEACGVFSALISMGFDVGDEVMQLYPALTAAADEVYDYIFGNEDIVELLAGVLFDEFFVHAKEVIAGKETQRVRVYSGHDLNVHALKALAKVPRQGIPNYGSLFSLELRRVVNTGKFVVLPVYLANPHSGAVTYLQVEGCGEGVLCDFDLFSNITAKHRLDEDTWRKICATD